MSTDDHASQFYDQGEGLPEDLPQSPFPIFKSWFDHAWAQMATPNPNAMTLATTHADGLPDARIVLCKDMDVDPGCILFYTNEHGSKGQQLHRLPFASAVFHWDHDQRQVRIRGPVTRATDAESDAYFASRRLESRIGAWVSEQSQPIESRQALLEKVAGVMEKLGISPNDLMEGRDIEIPRPPFWGGYRIHAQAVELWSAGVGRIHDRARWTREVSRPADPPQDRGPHACTYGPWSATRLQP